MPMSLVCAIKIPLNMDLISVLHMQNISILVSMLFWLFLLGGVYCRLAGCIEKCVPARLKGTKNVMSAHCSD